MRIQYRPPVPPGLYHAICTEVRDLGRVDSDWGPRPMVELVFTLAERHAEGAPRTLRSRYTASLSPKGRLRPTLERWIGRPLTGSEVSDLDLDELLWHRACRLEVVHVQGTRDPSAMFARVESIWPATSPNGGPDPREKGDRPPGTPFLTKDLEDLPPEDENAVPF
jgi:hypothetical protein